jgi:hypothetical protein
MECKVVAGTCSRKTLDVEYAARAVYHFEKFICLEQVRIAIAYLKMFYEWSWKRIASTMLLGCYVVNMYVE